MKKYFAVVLLCCAMPVQAHGDDHKDHAHAAPSAVLQTNAAVPSLSAHSELFEIVARLYPDELGLYVDNWSSNAPVLGARIEVELNGRKAMAKFHADHGDYALTDPEMLKTLHAAGTHALIFSISAANDADLLAGELQVSADAPAALGHNAGRFLFYGLPVLLLAAAWVVWRVLRRRKGGRK